VVIALLMGYSGLFAQVPADVRNLARNPFGDAIRVPLTESIGFNAGPYSRTAHSLQILPLIPFRVTDNWLLIPRIVSTGVTYVPDVLRPSGGDIGLGDTSATLFLTPFHSGRLIWGAGPSLMIPTATHSALGAGKWALGPAFAVVTQPHWGSILVAAQNVWSLPGHQQRGGVNQMQVETSLSLNLPENWYVFTGPTINAAWTETRRDRWLLPVGGGFGRTTNIGKQAVDMNVSAYYNAIRPATLFYPTWQLNLQLTLLYARKRRP
jgi:hypothetical protein